MGGYTRQNGNPISFNENGELTDLITFERGSMLLPEIVITGQKPENPVSKYIKELIYKGVDAFGKAVTYPVRALAYIEDTPQEDSYFNATKPYIFNTQDPGSNNIINVSNGVKGTRNRLEMMGMVKKGDKYYYLDKNGCPLGWCSENANMINRYFNRPTSGDAWTRHGIFGDSAVLVKPNVVKKKGYKRTIRQYDPINWGNGQYIYDNIDKVELQSGDIVDMHYPKSSFFNRAYREGDFNRANSHTGTILKTGPKKEDTYVMHYMGDGMLVEPIGKLLGPSITSTYITGIRRPLRKNDVKR